jgi:hypothetical protein
MNTFTPMVSFQNKTLIMICDIEYNKIEDIDIIGYHDLEDLHHCINMVFNWNSHDVNEPLFYHVNIDH